MDYTYFSAPDQSAYPFLGTLPPTPAHSYEVHNDHLGEPPPVPYPDPTSFQSFDPSFRYDQNAFVPHLQQSPPQPPQPPQRTSLANAPTGGSSGNVNLRSGSYDATEQTGNRSSDDEKEILTPAQSRRKAQNRTAQRAFRERKERHVKELESKLNSLEAHSSTLLTDNERLKRELAKLATQNEILRATTSSHPHPSSQPPRSPSPVAGPQTFSPTDFRTNSTEHVISHRTQHSEETGERLLTAGATWELIQASEAYRKGTIDVGDVIRRLKGSARCDGSGPAFKEGEVRRAIEESVSVGGDELI